MKPGDLATVQDRTIVWPDLDGNDAHIGILSDTDFVIITAPPIKNESQPFVRVLTRVGHGFVVHVRVKVISDEIP